MRFQVFHDVFGISCLDMTVRNLPGLEEGPTDWQAPGKTQRLWNPDLTLWRGQNEALWLSRLNVVEHQLGNSAALKQFAFEVREAGFEHALSVRSTKIV